MLLIPDGPQEPCRTTTLDWVPKVVSWRILSVAGTHIAAINFSVLRKEVKKTRPQRVLGAPGISVCPWLMQPSAAVTLKMDKTVGCYLLGRKD